ncbi:protein slowmo homolog 2 [Striga asiatica]|uniref:Protein slowmo homolog 2 n=1 Tax=Striga asiatica TaxID=4170 RepID=A0A5A7P276_STRAF|nr:protein slowmo homolog 2 [Striga asiatica]
MSGPEVEKGGRIKVVRSQGSQKDQLEDRKGREGGEDVIQLTKAELDHITTEAIGRVRNPQPNPLVEQLVFGRSASATSRALPSTPRAGKPSDHCRGSMRRCILHHVHRPSGVPFMTLVESGVPIETTFYVHALSRATFW